MEHTHTPTAAQDHEHDHTWEMGKGTRVDKKGNQIDRYQRSDIPLDYSHFELKHAASFQAVRPWLGAIVPPTTLPKEDHSQPAHNLKLHHVYGYRCFDSRQNIFYLEDGNHVVYMAGALGIIMNTTTKQQKFLGGGEKTQAQGHNDDITAIAITKDKKTLVTGSVGKEPKICVWSLEDGCLLHTFSQGRDTKAVRCISISHDGKYIATVAGDDNHTVALFDMSGNKIASESNGADAVTDLKFSTNSYEFASSGKNGVKFWNYDGKSFTNKKGIFGTHKLNDMWSVAWLNNGKCVSGSTAGGLYVWENHHCTKVYDAHTSAVTAVVITDDVILSSGRDNKVITFDTHFVKKHETTIRSNAKGMDIHTASGKIIAGLRDGSIVEIDGANVSTLMRSHSDGEVWGLCIDPTTGYVLTTADDNRILVFDPVSKKCVAEGVINQKAGPKPSSMGASTLSPFPPNQCARAIAVHPTKGHIAVGCNTGELQIRAGVKDINTVVTSNHDSKEWMEAITYSPCGKYLAVGSHDNNVYVYDVEHNYKLISKFAKQTSFVTSLDWSTDSKHIQSVSGSYELLFSDTTNGHQLTEGGHLLKDEQWATWTCKLGWPVQGIFPAEVEGSHINGVDRNNKKDLVATGDDWRLVNIHRYPCLIGYIPKSYVGHAEHVVRVKFDDKDEYLYSIGGFDRVLIQWKIE